jgi:hypothetical protein
MLRIGTTSGSLSPAALTQVCRGGVHVPFGFEMRDNPSNAGRKEYAHEHIRTSEEFP